VPLLKVEDPFGACPEPNLKQPEDGEMLPHVELLIIKKN
jgi:hypothetical protein